MSKLPKRILALIFALLGGSLGGIWLPSVWVFFHKENDILNNVVANIFIGALIFAVLSILFSKYIFKTLNSIESFLENKSMTYLLFGSIGLIVGLVIGTLVSAIFNYIKIPVVSDILPVLLIVGGGYLGFQAGTNRPDNWKKLFQQLRPQKQDNQSVDKKTGNNFHQYKILDTSVIIDGRIADIVKTRFIEGVLIVPLFVIHELQYIADSSDTLKRTKGRRGLDILNQLQKSKNIVVEVYEKDFEDILEVDSKLIKLAKLYNGVVVTNDYNLNKVCEIQNVSVLNINELANAIKPVVLPGETMLVHVVKEGTERQQGVAYLDDGTMIVVEDGKFHINESLEVVITSALQTAAGRMIFAKPIHSQRK